MFTLKYDRDGVLEDMAVGFYPVRHMQTAREHATRCARERGLDVLIFVNDRARVRITPDGRSLPPDGVEVAERSQCVKHEGKPCFCIACREDRKAAR